MSIATSTTSAAPKLATVTASGAGAFTFGDKGTTYAKLATVDASGVTGNITVSGYSTIGQTVKLGASATSSVANAVDLGLVSSATNGVVDTIQIGARTGTNVIYNFEANASGSSGFGSIKDVIDLSKFGNASTITGSAAFDNAAYITSISGLKATTVYIGNVDGLYYNSNTNATASTNASSTKSVIVDLTNASKTFTSNVTTLTANEILLVGVDVANLSAANFIFHA